MHVFIKMENAKAYAQTLGRAFVGDLLQGKNTEKLLSFYFAIKKDTDRQALENLDE
jgi:hypothetical protein